MNYNSQENPSQTRVLITGCSSGIGRATALYLAREGLQVIATAVPGDDLSALEKEPNIEIDFFDLVDREQCREAVERAGRIDVLINNAGYGLLGPMEMIPEERIKHQFDVNAFGMVRLSQLVLPKMRSHGRGKIINISSVAGKVTYALGGAYCASKHAIEAMSDAMRLELDPFGIKVVLIEPGTIDTKFYENANRRAIHTGLDPDSPYYEFEPVLKGILEQTKGSPPEVVSKVILKAIRNENPPARYVVTGMGKTFLFLRWLVPDRIMDTIIKKFMPTPQTHFQIGLVSPQSLH